MRSTRLMIVFLVLCLSGSGGALADGGRHRHHPRPGVIVNPLWGYGWGPWYPPHYYLPSVPPVCAEQIPPPAFLDQEEASPAESAPTTPAQTAYWYYCESQRAFYPYVQECPGGWKKILPHPPADSD
ncbi:MAG: hypothetical protein WC100_11625 [Sterolibacterium sp.]